jgi:aminoglycoside 3-N-acetyltransferase I
MAPVHSDTRRPEEGRSHTAVVTVRRLGPGHEREVLAAAHLLDEPPDPSAVRSYLAEDRNVFLVAEEGSRAVGFLRGTELGQLKSGQKQMFLYEIEVETKSRRRGIGGDLVRWLDRYCRERGFEEMFVFTDPSNEPAVRLYRSTGAVTETPADRMFVYRLVPSPGVPRAGSSARNGGNPPGPTRTPRARTEGGPARQSRRSSRA